jgi:hypothetical protein
MQYQRNFISLFNLLFVFASLGCGSSSTGDPFSGTGGMTGSGGVGGVGANAGTGGTAGTIGGGGTGGATAGCHPITCADGKAMLCGDCIDNDGDGFVDDKDPECLGPCDDTEGPILLTGTPGETGNQCGADCYFDSGNGSGFGECKWDRRCDPLEPKVDPSGDNPQCLFDADWVASPQGQNACPETQDALCEQTCGPLTPNGCDCFGCCTFPELNGGYIFLGSATKADGGTCTLNDLDDPELCKPCTPAGNCLNTCERCEICLGKTTIPPDCFPGTGGSGGMGGGGTGGDGGGMRCPVGKQACGLPGDPACPLSTFCLTGCCTFQVE